MDLAEVEDVRRLPRLEHHVVRDVDERRDAALAAAGQPLDHPGRRPRPRVDVADDTAGEAPAEVGRVDDDWQDRGVADLDGAGRGALEGGAGDGRQLAGDPLDAERVTDRMMAEER